MGNNSKTRAFDVVDNKGNRSNNSRQKLVIAIFVVIILILLAFATLIIGKVIENGGSNDNPIIPPIISNVTYVPKEAGDVKVGNLLLINNQFGHELTSDFSNMVNVKNYQRAAENASKTEINGLLTYTVTADRIVLEKNTLDAFNKMILDYCATLNLTGANQNTASNIEVAWGGYSEATKHEYESDLNTPSVGKEYWDHALGTTVTLKRYKPSGAITEDMLQSDFEWIYQNAHKYGFILRYPNSCADHTGFGGENRDGGEISTALDVDFGNRWASSKAFLDDFTNLDVFN